MKKQRSLSIILAVVMILGLVVGQASATWYLNESNVDLGVSGNYASVDIGVTGHAATFTVDADNALLGGGNNFGIDKFFFNTRLRLSDITQPDFSGPSHWEVKKNKNASGFDEFELLYTGTSDARRQDPLVFTITDNSITDPNNFYEANEEGYHFAAHIAGFTILHDDHRLTSAYVADGPFTPPPPAVPEPGTLILLGAGLFGLAAYGRKRIR